jgi:ubiquinone/menaquinone biosynthesis C-methylase UbiE
MKSEVVDKAGVLGGGSLPAPFILELGCGETKKRADAIGVDALDFSCVDIVGDVFDVLQGIPSGSVDEVYSSHFVEHLDDVGVFFGELGRVMKPGGTVEIIVPHFSNPYFYSDPTHRRFFGLYTFGYLAERSPFSRIVHPYQGELYFDVERVDLLFKSARPFYGRYAFKRVIGTIFNSCNYMKEFYEENLCYLFPCYEIRYQLRRH